MSASQMPTLAGTPKSTPAALLRQRKKEQANPLVKKKPQPRPPQQKLSALQPYGRAVRNGFSRSQSPAAGQTTSTQPTAGSEVNGLAEEFRDYPIVTTKRALLEGMRHHVMRFITSNSAGPTEVDPTKESQFTRPVRLHRRDPGGIVNGQYRDGSTGVSGVDGGGSDIDNKDMAQHEILKAQKRAEREANQGQIAPVSKAAPKRGRLQKKTEQVFQIAENSVKKKSQHLKYEESLPWHIEDFDNKNVWSSTYEDALSECHLLLIPGSEVFRMVPVEKWYRFTTQTRAFTPLSIEEAEARTAKKYRQPRWFMETKMAAERRLKAAAERQAMQGKLFTRKGERGERAIKAEVDDERPEMPIDADDIDYNVDEDFADDEEGPLFGGDDEEVKEAEQRIKREQLGANVFELKEQKDFDLEEEREKEEQRRLKKLGRKVAKALVHQEKRNDYEDYDSHSNPYTTDESSASEEDRRIQEDAKQSQDTKANAPTTDKATLAPPSTGTSTPLTRPKQPDPLRKILKRPGSPNLSEASGSESAHKKLKKKHPTPAVDGASISRPASPTNQPTAPAAPSRTTSSSKLNAPTQRPNGTAPRSSAASDAELSDAAHRAKKPRLPGSAAPSPHASRPGSPVAGKPAMPAAAAAAATAMAAAGRRKGPAPASLPSEEELKARIPPEGILLTSIINMYKAGAREAGFIPLVKKIARLDHATKKLYPRLPAPAPVVAREGKAE